MAKGSRAESDARAEQEKASRVLIVEDEEVSRQILRASLKGRGYEVLEARDGQEAWNLFLLNPTGIVVCDWMMPRLDGLELCRKVRRRTDSGYVYFILLTGRRIDREDYLHAMEAGIDDFLRKPLDAQELAVRLRVASRIVGMTRRLRQLEGLLPMCMYCKNIRQENGVYEPVEDYLARHSNARFTHGICPECKKERFPEYVE